MLRISLRGIKHFEAKKVDKPYRILKGSKDLLTQTRPVGLAVRFALDPKGSLLCRPQMGPIIFPYVLIVVQETYMTLSKHTPRSDLFEPSKMFYILEGDAEHI